jgi:hypothetical protein
VVEDAPIETALDAHPEEVVDVEIMKTASDGFDDTGIARDRASNDANEGERVDV